MTRTVLTDSGTVLTESGIRSVLTDSASRRIRPSPKKVMISDVLEVNSYKLGSPPRQKPSRVSLVQSTEGQSLRVLLDSDKSVEKMATPELQEVRENLREISLQRPSVMSKWRNVIICLILIVAIILLLFIILYYLHRSKKYSVFKTNSSIADITIVRTPTTSVVL